MTLPRYPTDSSPGSVMRVLDYVGTISFGLSGGATAAAAGMDMTGIAMVGTITAIGGGTVRDALFLGRRPFWTSETEYIGMAAGAALLGFVALKARTLTSPDEVDDSAMVRWSDAIGLSAFAVIGANNALALALPASICVLCGVATATFGGVIRDVLCGRQPRILYSKCDAYAPCAAVGAMTYTATVGAALPLHTAVAMGFSSALFARWASWTFDLKLPSYEKSDTNSARSNAMWHAVGLQAPLPRPNPLKEWRGNTISESSCLQGGGAEEDQEPRLEGQPAKLSSAATAPMLSAVEWKEKLEQEQKARERAALARSIRCLK